MFEEMGTSLEYILRSIVSQICRCHVMLLVWISLLLLSWECCSADCTNTRHNNGNGSNDNNNNDDNKQHILQVTYKVLQKECQKRRNWMGWDRNLGNKMRGEKTSNLVLVFCNETVISLSICTYETIWNIRNRNMRI